MPELLQAILHIFFHTALIVVVAFPIMALFVIVLAYFLSEGIQNRRRPTL